MSTKSISSATSASSKQTTTVTAKSSAKTTKPPETGISIIGPFPTDYRPPDKCTAVSRNAIVGLDFASTCLPSDFVTARTAYYSPGISCPPGYTAQSSCTRSSGSQTTITCCPTRVNFGFTLSCVPSSEAQSEAWWDMMCTWSAGTKTTVVLVTSTSGTKVLTQGYTMSGKMGINAYGLKMIYEATDLPTSTTKGSTSESTSPLTSPSTSSLLVTNVPDQSETETATPEPVASNKGLSVGAQAAIGVIVPLVVIGLGLGFFFWYRRRQRRFAVVEDDEPKELPLNPAVPPSELYGSNMVPSELPTQAVVAELPAELPESLAARPPASPTTPPPTTREDPSSLSPSSALNTSPALSNAAVSDAETASLERGAPTLPAIPTLTVSPAFSYASVSQVEVDLESKAPDERGPQLPPRP